MIIVIVMHLDMEVTNRLKLLRFEKYSSSSFIGLLKYSLDGKEQVNGLRFDIGKQIILDNLEDPQLNSSLKNPQIEQSLARLISQGWRDVRQEFYGV